MSKLLNKPLRVFTLYALVILALSIPAYYWVVDYIWLHELDEHNEIIKQRIENGFKNIKLNDSQTNEAIMVWNQIQPGVKISPALVTEVKKDSLYEIIRPNQYTSSDNIDRFRGLSTYISIQNRAYHLLIETNVEETHETMIAIAVVTVLFFSMLVIGFILLNRKIAQQIWKPFQHTLQQLKNFDLNSHKRLQLKSSDIEEFEELNSVLNKLIDNNIAVYNQQKQFTENASHELQTPLALLKAKIDLLLQDKTLNQKQLELISTLNTPLSRVSRINKNLLLLAKIENHQYADQEEVNLNDLLSENIEILSDYTNTKKISITSHINTPVFVRGNRNLLEIMLTNLLVNAIRHNTKNGSISIKYEAPVFCIYNTGDSSLNKETLFKRFVSASTHSPNSGLGLAIVKEICNRYGWEIDYSFQNNQHIFSIRFA